MDTRSEQHDAPARRPNEPARLASFLRADHDVFEEIAGRILQTVVEGDREDVSDAMSALEASVLTHLDGEEKDLIPRFALHDPSEAKLILQDHAAIRKRLTELDISTDLHLVRADALRLFLDALRAHAKREDTGLYRWAAMEGGSESKM
jgi:hypothetical protein